MPTRSGRAPGRPRVTVTDVSVRDTILETAIDMFLLYGYDGVSVDQVAKECDVTKASVYYYFASKSILFTSAMVRLMQHIRKHTVALLQQPKSLKERLVDITETHLDQKSVSFTDMFQKAKLALSDEQISQMYAEVGRMLAVIEEELTAEHQAGRIDCISPALAARSYVALMCIGHQHCADGSPLFANHREAAEQVVALLFHGLEPRK